MKANEKVIWSLLDCLRGTGLQSLGVFELSLQLLAWAKLSRVAAIPAKLRLTEKTKIVSTKELRLLFEQLSELKSLGKNRPAFQAFLVMREELDDQALVAAIDIAYEFSDGGKLDRFEVPESCYTDLGRTNGLPTVPSEVTDLMLALAGPLAKKRVYCPYDTACQFARRANQAGAELYVESLLASPIPWLINILTGTDIHTQSSDPVRQPSYLTKNGKLDQFDMTISFPPMGVKYEAAVVEQDGFSRFPDRTSSGSVLQIRHILAQTNERAVVAVPNSILFSRGAEHALRQDLLKRGVIEAVIGMPPAILPFTAVQFSMLILNPHGGIKKIRFVDGGNECFYERDGRSRSRLVSWKDLLDAFRNSKDEEIALDIPVKNVFKNDTYLEVSRYLLPPEHKKIEQLLKESEVRHLDDLVKFIRPFPKMQSDGELTAYEVSVADFPDFGYLTTPQRMVTLARAEFTAKEADTFLQSGDIVIATKGSVGKSAIVPETVPLAGEGGWLVNQSCLILRANGGIEPKALFMYLRSELGQALLHAIVSGATIPLIQLRTLQQLKIAVPSMKEAKSISITFDTQVKLQEKIEELRREQHKLSKVHWRIEN